ncbi:MAG: response regulator [Acidimicrobiia bacterium]
MTRESRRVGGVLVVDDETGIRDVIAMTLEMEGIPCTVSADGMQALHLVNEINPDVIVLDLMMPGVSGMEVLEKVREKSNVPILLLTALNSEDNVVLGLRKGADDYVVKPFSGPELVARVEALLRRARNSVPSDELRFGSLVIDLPRRTVTLDGNEIELTAKEFDLLVHLAKAPGKVFTREDLLQAVWNSSSQFQQEGTVTEHVRRLRQKIETDPEHPTWVETVRGVGYRFERRRRPR